MTCAHVVDVALRKVSGVDSVEVSLNKGLATVKLKTGNTVKVPQLWQLLHEKGYTPRKTAVSVRGELADVKGHLELKVSGTTDTLAVLADPNKSGVYADGFSKVGRAVTVQGVMVPLKDLKAPVPLQVSEIK